MSKEQMPQGADYQKRVEQAMPKSPIVKDCIRAFLVGGFICLIGQGVSQLGKNVLELDKEACSAFTSIVMVFLGAILTGLGVYDKISKFGGAGAAVPITGFSNGVVSPAMEFRREGLVMGVGAKMFIIAGPVLVYGTLASTLVGVIYYFMR